MLLAAAADRPVSPSTRRLRPRATGASLGQDRVSIRFFNGLQSARRCPPAMASHAFWLSLTVLLLHSLLRSVKRGVGLIEEVEPHQVRAAHCARASPRSHSDRVSAVPRFLSRSPSREIEAGLRPRKRCKLRCRLWTKCLGSRGHAQPIARCPGGLLRRKVMIFTSPPPENHFHPAGSALHRASRFSRVRHAHAHTHARKHARTHARTHAT